MIVVYDTEWVKVCNKIDENHRKTTIPSCRPDQIRYLRIRRPLRCADLFHNHLFFSLALLRNLRTTFTWLKVPNLDSKNKSTKHATIRSFLSNGTKDAIDETTNKKLNRNEHYLFNKRRKKSEVWQITTYFIAKINSRHMWLFPSTHLPNLLQFVKDQWHCLFKNKTDDFYTYRQFCRLVVEKIYKNVCAPLFAQR